MFTLSDLKFREAGISDLQAILEIHNVNVRGSLRSNAQGFLLTRTTESELVENLNRTAQYFVAVKNNGEVIGFVAVAQPRITDEFLDKIVWKVEDCRSQILSTHHLYIQILATQPDYMGQGVARFMYASLYEKFPNAWMSAFIVINPIANDRSLRFHQQQGFEWVGTLHLEQFLDLQNYESGLMLKAPLVIEP